MNSGGSPLAGIVVVAWNGASNLEILLPSLTPTIPANVRLYLVDNASTDGSADVARALHPDVVILRNEANLGFTGGNNPAIARALSEGCEYVILLNDDTKIVDDRWLDDTLSLFSERPDVAAIGYELLASPSESTPRDLPRIGSPTLLVSGCALALRSTVLESIGPFDDAYFAYAEEDDLESRIARAGYVMLQINRQIVHFGERTSSRVSEFAAFLELRNSLRFAIKWRNPLGVLIRFAKLAKIVLLPQSFSQRFPNHRRARGPGGLPARLARLLRAVWWNVTHLPQTLQIRHDDLARIHRSLGSGPNRERSLVIGTPRTNRSDPEPPGSLRDLLTIEAPVPSVGAEGYTDVFIRSSLGSGTLAEILSARRYHHIAVAPDLPPMTRLRVHFAITLARLLGRKISASESDPCAV